MKSQSRAPHSAARRRSAGASRTASQSPKAKPIALTQGKANGHGKSFVEGRARAVGSKSLVAKAVPSKAKKLAKEVSENAATSPSHRKAKPEMGSNTTTAAKKRANGNGPAGSANSKMVARKGPAATNGTTKAVAAKVPETNPRATVSSPSNGQARTGKITNTGNGTNARRANGAQKPAAKAPITNLPVDYRPTDNEPFMGELHRLYFRRKLLTWREEILRSTKETLQSLHDDQAHYADIADRATSESDKALELRARDRQRKLIAKIDAAIERIDRGTYGYCDETGEPIAVRRLDARPIATLSIEAQERHERRERVYRDD